MSATKVTASHPDQGEQTIEITDNFVVVVDGTARKTHEAIHRAKDGTQTHVITIKGVRP